MSAEDERPTMSMECSFMGLRTVNADVKTRTGHDDTRGEGRECRRVAATDDQEQGREGGTREETFEGTMYR